MTPPAPPAAGTPDATAPGYDADIRPKFRPGDITCMQRRHVNLGNAAWMCDPAGNSTYPDHANARRVYDALSQGLMPPDSPWPADWIATYQSWMQAGFNP
jgi:hypothetical protein